MWLKFADNVGLHIDGVLYVRVDDPYKASYGVEDPEYAVTQLAQTTMRSEIGKLMNLFFVEHCEVLVPKRWKMRSFFRSKLTRIVTPPPCFTYFFCLDNACSCYVINKLFSGKLSLDSIFHEREILNISIVKAINAASEEPWGIHCLRYEIRDIQVCKCET